MAFPHQLPHGWMHGRVFTLSEDWTAHKWNGHGADPEYTEIPWPKGTRVKVTALSRFWDAGITTNLEAEFGYEARVDPGILVSEVPETPEQAQSKAEAHECWVRQQAVFAEESP